MNIESGRGLSKEWVEKKKNFLKAPTLAFLRDERGNSELAATSLLLKAAGAATVIAGYAWVIYGLSGQVVDSKSIIIGGVGVIAAGILTGIGGALINR